MASPADRALELVAIRHVQRRAFNERLEAIDASAPEALYRCECGLIACDAIIKLTAGEYASVRAEPRRFAVLAAHTVPEAQRIVERNGSRATVEMLPGRAADIAGALGPRRVSDTAPRGPGTAAPR